MSSQWLVEIEGTDGIAAFDPTTLMAVVHTALLVSGSEPEGIFGQIEEVWQAMGVDPKQPEWSTTLKDGRSLRVRSIPVYREI